MKKLMVVALAVGLASLANAGLSLSSNSTVAAPSDNITIQVKADAGGFGIADYGYIYIVVQAADGTISGGVAAAGNLTAYQGPAPPFSPGEAGIGWFIGDSGGATFPPGTTLIDAINFHMASASFTTIKMYWTPDFVSYYVVDTLTIVGGKITCISMDSPIFPLWDIWGQPDCWCGRYMCRGDADMTVNGPFPVASPDLVIMLGAFNKMASQIPAGSECANFDLKMNGPFLVASPDLTLLLDSIGDMAFLVPECSLDWDGDGDDDFNFWLN